MNRRGRSRAKTDLTAKITCLDQPDSVSRARLADISAHGLSLILNNEISVGCSVKVEWGRFSFVGESIYCNRYGQEFLVGLKVDDPVYETARKGATQ